METTNGRDIRLLKELLKFDNRKMVWFDCFRIEIFVML